MIDLKSILKKLMLGKYSSQTRRNVSLFFWLSLCLIFTWKHTIDHSSIGEDESNEIPLSVQSENSRSEFCKQESCEEHTKFED